MMQKPIYGIIPAAGEGLRFGEISKRYPKCLLPYKNKPILIHNIETLFDCGAKGVIVSVSPANYLKVSALLDFYEVRDVELVFVHPTSHNAVGPVGPAVSALAAIKKAPVGSQCLMVLSDIVIPQNERFRLKHMINNAIGACSFMTATPVSKDKERWCMAEFNRDTYKLVKFHDKKKNSPAEHALNGVYYFDRDSYVAAAGEWGRQTENTPVHQTELQFSEVFNTQAFRDSNVIHILTSLRVLDFGTLSQYLDSRDVYLSRSFNEISMTETSVRKSSPSNPEKLYRERSWLQNIPWQAQHMVPKVFEFGFDWYRMENVKLPTLRELFVWMDNDPTLWRKIFHTTLGSLCDMNRIHTFLDKSYWPSVLKKTEARASGLSPEFVKEFGEMISKESRVSITSGILHGDACASNIFYDVNRNQIKLIDPNGSMYGSRIYDWAKMYHSFVCMYDIVDTEMYVKNGNVVKLYTRGKRAIAEAFLEELKGFTYDMETTDTFLRMVVSSLFLSMIPLHAHNKTNQLIYLYIHKWIWNNIKNDVPDLIPDGDWIIDLTEVEKEYDQTFNNRG